MQRKRKKAPLPTKVLFQLNLLHISLHIRPLSL